MPYTYILKSCKTNKTYVGSTIDIENRINEHNSGGCTFTKNFRPWQLCYKEKFTSLKEARRREKYFKSCAGRKLIKKLLYNPR